VVMMKKEGLVKLKEKLLTYNAKELLERDLYLRDLAGGKLEGPLTGYASIDKPWLKYYKTMDIMSGIPYKVSALQLIKEKNYEHKNRVAIKYFGNMFTYKEMFLKIDEFASRFKELGVKCGDIVSIAMPTTPETVFSFYALNKIGAICDMIDPRSNGEQMKYYLNENKSKLLILCENYYKNMKNALDEIDIKTILLPITVSASLGVKLLVDSKVKLDNLKLGYSKNIMKWQEFMKLDKDRVTYQEYNDKDLALIVHSSGTTSVPKGIMITNRNINSIAISYSKTSLNLNIGDRFLSVIPAFASFGMITSINLPFYLTMENYLIPQATPDNFVKSVEKFKPNFCLTIPANFINLMKKSKLEDYSFFYGPGCGGYSLDSSKEEEINNYLLARNAPVPMLMGWGMSELSSTACLEVPECSKLLSSGIPLIKNTISIFEPGTDNELSYNEEGEICVTGPSVMYGYLNNEEKTNATIKIHSDGKAWLHSNDVGYMDSDGRLYPVDRLERMIIKGIDGFKIFPQKIEEVIASSIYVDACCVVGYNGKYGIYPKACVVLKQEYLDKRDEALVDIKNICSSKLSVRAIPDEFEFIDKLPYTSLGKVDYKSLENNNESYDKENTSGRKKIKKR